MVLLDANTLVYYLDETADKNIDVVKLMQQLVDDQEQVVTSHHIIEEVLFTLSKIEPDANLKKAVSRIGEIPGIILVEPSPHLAFAERYATLTNKLKLGINDALILQLMIDAGITKLFSYDKQFVNRANELGIQQIV